MPRLTNSAAITEFIHPNIYSIYKLLEYVEKLVLQKQMSLLNRANLRSTGQLQYKAAAAPSVLLAWFGDLGDRKQWQVLQT